MPIRSILKIQNGFFYQKLRLTVLMFYIEARRGNTRAMYQKLNELRGKAGTGIDLLRDSRRNLVRGTEERRRRWKEHFEALLNVGDQPMPSEVMEKQSPNLVDEEPAPSEAEVERAIKKLKNGKAAGCDGINAEMLKAGRGVLIKWIHRLISKIWQNEVVPDDWHKVIVVHLFKKGDKSV